MEDPQEELKKQVMELNEWVAKHPHVAKDMDDKLLRRFLHSCYYDMQKTQKAMEAFSSIRTDAPAVFGDRDSLGQRVKQAFEYVTLAFVPISGNRRLWIFQINDPGFRKFEHLEFIRTILLAFDAWLLEEGSLQDGDLTLFDAKDTSLKIFWRIHLSLQKIMFKYQEEAMPIRIKQMHMVNTPSFMDKLYSILKPFMSKEMSDVLHFHAPKSDTLFQYFSKDDLPKDFGGNLNSLEVYNKEIIDLIHKHSDALNKDDLWKTPKK
ncbi:alpha-tocopherol transfer protein-like [Cydia pomonella]|uniref:alpha-tocopherol transfer protein-like n=1 Tax=Cydia pomonella TaxID=82600 RepID=UPI002ADD34CF|nr:alpha-tocopherol transfer protein-like [Cydia pomonella]XP_061719945.1 alpha-tocopherol transfer protein-like [Cydia pomonella]XP_061719946.1 alpha-tocopherol transfer protein-like [Cydia pomonella]